MNDCLIEIGNGLSLGTSKCSILFPRRLITLVRHGIVFEFLDRVFNENMSTRDIFEQEAKKLVLGALDGYNVTIFAYGQTASGKTFTM